MITIEESDWKILRAIHPLARERFCERIFAEIDAVRRDDSRRFHERYLEIYKIIEQRDREISRIFDDLKRSTALVILAQMRAHNLLTDEEFSRLGPQTRGAIGLLLGTDRTSTESSRGREKEGTQARASRLR